jgi:adenylosuccinate synthase
MQRNNTTQEKNMQIDKKVTLIVDLQYGSTGKGKVAGWWAKRYAPDVVINANMPNAGHTYIDRDGHKYVHKVLPNGIVCPRLRYVGIGAGSVFSIEQLQKEIDSMPLYSEREFLTKLRIHENSVILQDWHKLSEESFSRIGSTQQGSMAALVSKMHRDPNSDVIARDLLLGTKFEQCLVSQSQWLDIVGKAERILAEGAQGYDLGISTQFYPYCTSRDCTPARMLADMGIPLPLLSNVIGVLRPYPIRVAGTSGRVHEDQEELSWEMLGVEPEKTTVTKKVRRVFSFSDQQLREALDACAPNHLVLNFTDYLPTSGTHGLSVSGLVNRINTIARQQVSSARVEQLGTGPTHDDVLNLVRDPLTVRRLI